jgi:sulfur carrier protein ThiS
VTGRVRITIHMHGNLRRFLPGGQDRAAMEVAPATTIASLLASLGAARDIWLVAVNGAVVDPDRVLDAEDVVDCFEPVAAG